MTKRYFINMYLGFFAKFQGTANNYTEGKIQIWSQSRWLTSVKPTSSPWCSRSSGLVLSRMFNFASSYYGWTVCSTPLCTMECKWMDFEQKEFRVCIQALQKWPWTHFWTYVFICKNWHKNIYHVGLSCKLNNQGKLAAKCLVPVTAAGSPLTQGYMLL